MVIFSEKHAKNLEELLPYNHNYEIDAIKNNHKRRQKTQ
jgi:hypothetical protein